MMAEHERMNYWWRRAIAAEERVQKLQRESEERDADLARVDRVVVVDEASGRRFDARDMYSNGARIAIQDDGRTLKILPG